MSESTPEVLQKIDAYYSNALRTHGATPRGVDWNSNEAQTVRFAQITKIADGDHGFSINDFGCGYGALVDFLGNAPSTYTGFDVSEAMIAKARELYGSAGRTFTTNLDDVSTADYSVASGIFSVKMDVSTQDWERYIHETLDRMAERSTKGFAFNMLTGFSDPEKMRSDLYYADAHRFFDLCRTRYARNVALLHDYGLYEFTILVRLQLRRPS